MKETIFTPDMMRLELLPAYANDAQQGIADISGRRFDIQKDSVSNKAAGRLKLAAERLKVCGLSEYRDDIGRISFARVIDKAEEADREAGGISDELKRLCLDMYKENMLLDTYEHMLKDFVDEIELALKALDKHISNIEAANEDIRYVQLARKRYYDLNLSQTVALRSASLLNDIKTANTVLADRINSLNTITMVLWRADLAALKAVPDNSRLEKICSIEDMISSAIVNIIR